MYSCIVCILVFCGFVAPHSVNIGLASNIAFKDVNPFPGHKDESADQTRGLWPDGKDARQDFTALETVMNNFRESKAKQNKNMESLLNRENSLTQENKSLKNKINALQEIIVSLLDKKEAAKHLAVDVNTEGENNGRISTDPRTPEKPSSGSTTKTRKTSPRRSLPTSSASDRVPRSDDSSLASIQAIVDQQSQQINELKAAVEELHEDDEALHHLQIVSTASTYIRWGSSSCPSTSELVYSGVLGGAETVVKTGAATNHLCLTTHPVLADKVVSSGPRTAGVYGGEYEVPGRGNLDPVCAVCRSHRPTNIMVPGTNQCPSGQWTKEYNGYLMASADDHRSGSQFICVDHAMESRMGSEAGRLANELFFAVGVCGTSLPCPPYTNGTIVTCAVCSM